MISQKAKYALKALATLAEERARGGAALTIEEIAGRASVPKRFLEHILLVIKRAGIIGSRRGRIGGYQFIKDPGTVTLGAVLRLIDGPIAPLPCLSRGAYQRCEDCANEATCAIRRAFFDVFAAYLLLVESMTIEDLIRGASLPEVPLRRAVAP
jgi:Rrf2 family protein